MVSSPTTRSAMARRWGLKLRDSATLLTRGMELRGRAGRGAGQVGVGPRVEGAAAAVGVGREGCSRRLRMWWCGCVGGWVASSLVQSGRWQD